MSGTRSTAPARSEGRLRELAGELAAEYGARAQVVPADLTRPASPGEMAEALAQRHIDVDVLVNNAGFGAHGPVAEMGAERQLEMIEVNVVVHQASSVECRAIRKMRTYISEPSRTSG